MMIVVVVIFAVCWLPYHVYFLLAHHLPWIITVSNVQHTYLSIYWLAMSNSMYNPIIYCWMNSRFRQGFKNVFFCCKWKEEHVNPFEKRNFATVRHSYSEPYTDTRVTINGNTNLALHTVTESLNGSHTSSTPFLTPKTPRADRFSNV
ncbi:tachykinin-like peptides receptor 99D [Caerostris darwini]|uniref:Tachykinin-like peptides receptor 99D n=1 Tax=Caerostris darwini TaxID=1538125 RepID=A0AAV4N5N5_9ARAC|nr:hypothetical protein CDAR_173551 [Caerostris darwini]GIX80019.1 tachykinin-like peptides receptor 99D [Caerostris darwini]